MTTASPAEAASPKAPRAEPPRAPRSVAPPAVEDAKAAFQARLAEVAHDLFALEVNTIVKDSMMATKMPPPAHALLDIVNDYHAALEELGAPKRKNPSAAPEASLGEFHDLRTRASDRAKQMMDVLSGKVPASEAPKEAAPSRRPLTRADQLLLCRIRDNSDQIKGIFRDLNAREGKADPGLCFTRENAPRVRLLPDEMITLRKIWEVGTEEVVMQTVIHLDGDVVTRIRRAYAEQDKRPIVDIHNAAITTSTGFWFMLVDTLGAFVKNIGQLFFPT